jgi:hypothetical protein
MKLPWLVRHYSEYNFTLRQLGASCTGWKIRLELEPGLWLMTVTDCRVARVIVHVISG